MVGAESFTRASVLVTAYKRLANGRMLPVRGSFARVRAGGLAFRPDDAASPLSGFLEIDLGSLTTNAPERDANVREHLFGGSPAITAVLEPGGALVEVGVDAWCWHGSVALSLDVRLPVALAIRRRRLADRVELSTRLERRIDVSISELGLPFRAFLEAVGVSSVLDRVELDVGVVADEQATRPRRRVAIAGGGIAGLASAQVLVDGGFDVTVVEKEPACGGKLTSHVDETLGHTLEHGIHGVFPRYRNLVALWREAGIGDEIFADTRTLGVASPSGMSAGRFHELSTRAPFFLLEMVPEGVFRGRDVAACTAFLGRVYGTRRADRARLDRETFQALLDRYGVTGPLQRYLMHPYVKNLSYARPDQVSAAAACDALGYYLLEDAGDFKARWFDGGPQELVIDPWVEELARRGVRFLTRTPVQFVVFEGGRFHGFATRALIPERRLGPQDRCWVQRFGSRVVALRWEPEAGELRAWDGLCTHAGCPLQPAGENGEKGFRCDCHGGAFGVDGRVVRAPPKRDLPVLPVSRDEIGGEAFWKLSLEESSDAEALVPADYGVVALDIEGAKRVLTPALLDLASLRGIPTLRTTPVIVLRMWFRGTGYTGPDSGFFAEGDLLDNFFVLSRFQREFREVEGYTIVEGHIGDAAGFEGRDDEDILEQAARCLARYFDDLGPDALDLQRSRVLRHRDGFTLFAPGDAARAPEVAADDRPNLLFVGDWVRSKVRAWYMERAAVTGIEAANRVLDLEGLTTRPVLRTERPGNLLPRIMALPFEASGALGRAYRAAVRAEPERPAPIAETVDLSALLDDGELALVHPSVRAFFADPLAFDVTIRPRLPSLIEKLLRRGLPISPLVRVVDGRLCQTLDVHGIPVTLDFAPSRSGDGIRLERVRTTPAALFGSLRIAYETRPTHDGISTVGVFRHPLAPTEWRIELVARRRAHPAARTAIPVPLESEVRLRSAAGAETAGDLDPEEMSLPPARRLRRSGR